MWVTLTSVGRRLCQRFRNENGATAVEFAIITPVLLLLLSAIIEGGVIIHTWGNMEYTARQAARSAAIGEFTKQEAQDFIVSRMQKSVGAPAATAVVTFVTGAQPINNEVVVDVTVPAGQIAQIQILGLFQAITLSTKVTMHREIGS